MPKFSFVGISIALGILLFAHSARADGVDPMVTFNTSALTTLPGSNGGPFELAFVFTDGSGTGDGNNTVTLSSFTLGGGSVGALDSGNSGGVPGSLGSTITLSDTSFFNFFGQDFVPGSTLSFDLATTSNVDSGGTPDQLDLFILAPGLTSSACGAIPTTDPSGNCALLQLIFNSPSGPAAQFFSGTGVYSNVTGGFSSVIPTPEPTTSALLVTGLVLLLRRRRKVEQ